MQKLLLTLAFLCTQVHATLHDRGNGLVFDDVLNITWAQDASLPRTLSAPWYREGGGTSPDDAAAWAADLEWAGFGDWRLPKMLVDEAWISEGCVGIGHCGVATEPMSSELAFMFLVNLPSNNVSFSGVEPRVFLMQQWASHCYPEFGWYCDSSYRWSLDFENGVQQPIAYLGAPQGAWVVRDGDVTPIPEPPTVFLLLAGLMLSMCGRAARSRDQSALAYAA